MNEPSAQQVKDQRLYAQWGLTDEEFQHVSEDILGRLPNYTETGLYSVMWSEHCSYKNSKALLRGFPTDSPAVLQGPGEGAGVVDIGDGLAVVFKVESHNHPSAVEPYEGAATGVGGILRDVFSMGATPIACLNSLRFGELDDARTRFLVREVIAGIAGYGNAMGVPTVGGEIGFEPCYQGNPLVNAMTVGLIKHEDVQRGRAWGAGNPVVYVGAKTGRDGIHGATFASEAFAEGEEEQERSAVQAGDPFVERMLMDACLDLIHNHADILVGIQDMGAAGLVSSSSEMASKAGAGMKLDLDKVPTREEGMTPYEMMLSESQERMLLCIKDGAQQEVIDLFKGYGLEAVVIGEVTDEKGYQLFFKGDLVADLPVDSLAEAPEVVPEKAVPSRLSSPSKAWSPHVSDASETLLQLLARPTIASKRHLYQTFDYMARANTVVPPSSDAAVVRVPGTNRAVAMTTDCNSGYLYLNPRVGGQMAVAEATANLVASGARPLAITDGLNFGSPDNPEAYWELAEATGGIAQACEALGVPVVSGNVSLYNETDTDAIYPTPVIGAVGVVDDVSQVTTQHFKDEGDVVCIIGTTGADFSGSELQKAQEGSIFGPLANFDLAMERASSQLVLAAIQAGIIKSAHDVAEGGLAVAIAESAFTPATGGPATELGVDLETDLPIENLFSETPSRFVVSVAPSDVQQLMDLANDLGDLPSPEVAVLGDVTADPVLRIKAADGEISVPTSVAREAWEDAIPTLLAERA